MRPPFPLEGNGARLAEEATMVRVRVRVLARGGVRCYVLCVMCYALGVWSYVLCVGWSYVLGVGC